MPHRKFLELNLKKLKLKKHPHIYRIYKNSKEFIDIEAPSACHAIEESDIKFPLKVIFLGYTDVDKILNQDDVEITEDQDPPINDSIFPNLDSQRSSINDKILNQDKIETKESLELPTTEITSPEAPPIADAESNKITEPTELSNPLTASPEPSDTNSTI